MFWVGFFSYHIDVPWLLQRSEHAYCWRGNCFEETWQHESGITILGFQILGEKKKRKKNPQHKNEGSSLCVIHFVPAAAELAE